MVDCGVQVMKPFDRWRTLAVALATSSIAPGNLLAAGVDDRPTLVVVFVPGVVSGIATAWFAVHRLIGRSTRR